MHVKMLEDAQKKLQQLLDRLNRGGDAQLEAIYADLQATIAGLKRRDFTVVNKNVVTFMTTIYSHDAAQNQWVMGLKRLLEVLKAQTN